MALGQCDLAVVVGTPLDFRLGYGSFGGKQQAPRAQVVHIADTPGQVSRHTTLAGSACGDLTSGLDGLLAALESSHPARPGWSPWTDRLRDLVSTETAKDAELLTSVSEPIHPARIYGELIPRLAENSVVIGDGGDFVSFAGRYVEPARPGG